jgi:hypothetical protein
LEWHAVGKADLPEVVVPMGFDGRLRQQTSHEYGKVKVALSCTIVLNMIDEMINPIAQAVKMPLAKPTAPILPSWKLLMDSTVGQS